MKKSPFKIQNIIDERDKIIRASNEKILQMAKESYPIGAHIEIFTDIGSIDVIITDVRLSSSYVYPRLKICVKTGTYKREIYEPEDIHPKDRCHGEPSYLSDVQRWGVGEEKI